LKTRNTINVQYDTQLSAQLLLCLNQMLYALGLSYHSNTEAVLFACLSSGWAITTGRLLGFKMGNSIKYLSLGHSDALPHQESNQGFATEAREESSKY